jgi:hypothetical protein
MKMSNVGTKFQVGVAACALATATTLTPVMAQADPALPSPLAPITSSEISLSPISDIALAPCTFNPAVQCNGIFGLLAEAAVGIGIGLASGFVSITNVIIRFIGQLFGIGPYSTSRQG